MEGPQQAASRRSPLGSRVESRTDRKELKVDFPHDVSLCSSHEATYQAQALYVDGRGALKARARRLSAYWPGIAGAACSELRRKAGPKPREEFGAVRRDAVVLVGSQFEDLIGRSR